MKYNLYWSTERRTSAIFWMKFKNIRVLYKQMNRPVVLSANETRFLRYRLGEMIIEITDIWRVLRHSVKREIRLIYNNILGIKLSIDRIPEIRSLMV